MPTHKSARELLEKLVNEAIIVGRPAEIDITLVQLAELVRADKELHTHDSIPNYTSNANEGCITCIRNQALEHIAQKLEGK
jgi:hypothetical protein